MSAQTFNLPDGREVVADPPSWAFGQRFTTATEQAVWHCERLGLEKINPADLDLTTSRKKAIRKDGGGYYRYYEGDPAEADDAAVAYCVLPPGYLILLAEPGGAGGRSTNEYLGHVRGREPDPGERIRSTKYPSPWR